MRIISTISITTAFLNLTLPHDALTHGTYMELRVQADEPTAKDAQGRALRRVPAFAHWVEQDQTMPGQWCARLWQPEEPFRFKHHRPHLESFPRIYEAHVGMAQPALNRSAESGQLRQFYASYSATHP